MTPEEMKHRKLELGYTNADIARLAGVPLGTVNKIFSGATKAPRRENILSIESVLSDSKQKSAIYASEISEEACMVCEPENTYQAGTSPTKKLPGEFTLDDYLALPEGVMVELIDGVFYDMAGPHVGHQFISVQIVYQLMSYIEKNNGPCRTVTAPVDVQLDKDDKTIVQPDVVMVCDPKSMLKNGRVFGAPDFVIEVLSPSTQKRDLTLKLQKYSTAGVKELWYVDPKNQKVLVYDLRGESSFPVIYSFKDEIPVLIWNSEFSVDFKAVYTYSKDAFDD